MMQQEIATEPWKRHTGKGPSRLLEDLAREDGISYDTINAFMRGDRVSLSSPSGYYSEFKGFVGEIKSRLRQTTADVFGAEIMMLEPERTTYVVKWLNALIRGDDGSQEAYDERYRDSEPDHFAFGMVETTNLLGIKVAQRTGKEGLLLVVGYEGIINKARDTLGYIEMARRVDLTDWIVPDKVEARMEFGTTVLGRET
jgi:hypothetical protein